MVAALSVVADSEQVEHNDNQIQNAPERDLRLARDSISDLYMIHNSSLL